jgi:RimJ/RimL family protein N-acetyltransferase
MRTTRGPSRIRSLRMRDARPEDKRAVFEFTRRTWGQYGDFIPRVWNRWISDRAGRFIVAELDGVPVGTARIRDFGNGEIWLEGLRVDPRHRGKGVARAISLEVLRALRRMHPRAVRYCTGAGNKASRHIGASFGFRIAARLRYYWLRSRAGTLAGEFASPRDRDALHRFMKDSKFLSGTAGLVAEGWIFRELTPELLASYIRRRRAMVIRKAGKIVGAAVYPVEVNDKSLTMGFVDGQPAAVKALARNCRYLARMHGHKFCSVAVPSRGFPRLLDGAGFSRKDSMGQVVLEYADPARLAGRRRTALRAHR